MKNPIYSCVFTSLIGLGFCLMVAGAGAQSTSIQSESNAKIGDQRPCVVVMGAVPTDTRVHLLRPLRLMEVLFLAGGLTEGAGEVVRVVHGSPEIRCAQIPTFDWKPNENQTKSYRIAALKRDEESANPYLLAGDIVAVERLPSIGVVGCVADGKWFHIRAPITLTRAVAMVGGPIKKAHRVAILRGNPSSPDWPIVIQGNLDLITKGKAIDPLLQDGDTIEVLRKSGDMCGAHIFW